MTYKLYRTVSVCVKHEGDRNTLELKLVRVLICKHAQRGADQDFDVQQQRPVLDVP